MSVVHPDELHPSAASDADVIAHVALGNPAAFDTLFERYAPDLGRFAARIDAADAERVLQRVFLRVLCLADTFCPKTMTARAWLFAITSRVVNERAWSIRRMVRVLLRCMGRRAPQQAIERAVSQLPRSISTILLLRETEGFSCDEIAAMLSIPASVVAKRLHDARRQLHPYAGANNS